MNRVMSALLVAGMVGLAVSSAQGAVLITFDVRALGPDPKVVTAGVGDTIQLQLWAIIANGDGSMANDGFWTSPGSLVSTGPLLGTMRGDVYPVLPATKTNNVAPFAETGAQSGYQMDVDGDGDLDLGSYDTGGPAVSPWFIATSGTSAVLGNVEVLIGQFAFTVTGGAGMAEIEYIPRNRLGGTSASRNIHKFTSDGVAYLLPGSSDQIGFGAPVTIMPEPATMALLGLGGLVALLRRKR